MKWRVDSYKQANDSYYPKRSVLDPSKASRRVPCQTGTRDCCWLRARELGSSQLSTTLGQKEWNQTIIKQAQGPESICVDYMNHLKSPPHIHKWRNYKRNCTGLGLEVKLGMTAQRTDNIEDSHISHWRWPNHPSRQKMKIRNFTRKPRIWDLSRVLREHPTW